MAQFFDSEAYRRNQSTTESFLEFHQCCMVPFESLAEEMAKLFPGSVP
jgi:hypothetical protein